jgi:hypothetical protein
LGTKPGRFGGNFVQRNDPNADPSTVAAVGSGSIILTSSMKSVLDTRYNPVNAREIGRMLKAKEQINDIMSKADEKADAVPSSAEDEMVAATEAFRIEYNNEKQDKLTIDNEQLSEIPTIPQNELADRIIGHQGKYEEIDRRLLEPAPEVWNFFSPPSEEKLLMLLDSIEKNGLLQPLVVRVLDLQRTRFQILAGHTREKVHEMLYQYYGDEKWLKIGCMVYEYGEVSDDQAEDFVIDTNVANAHSELNPRDRALGYYRKYLKIKARTEWGSGEDVADKVAEFFGIRRSTYFVHKNFIGLIPEFGSWLTERRIGIKQASKIGKFSPQIQKWMLDEFPDKLTKKKIMKLTAKMTPPDIRAVLTAESDPTFMITVPVSKKPPKGTVPVVLYLPMESVEQFKQVYQQWLEDSCTLATKMD